MPESPSPQTKGGIAEAAWQKAVMGQGLTPSESNALHRARGIRIPPTLPEAGATTSEEVPCRTSAVAEAVQQNLMRRDRRDLVTGENVVNIPLREPAASDNIRISPAQINGLSSYYDSGRSADLRLIVQEIDRVLLPGFRQILTAEEQAQLADASPQLIRKIHEGIMRMSLADRTNVLIAKIERGLDRYVTPLLPKIRNPHARASIEACLNVWKANAENPYINLYERTARSASDNPGVHAEYKIPLMRVNPRFISVGIAEGGAALDNVGAAYSDLTSTMFLQEQPHAREMDFCDILAVIHESTHAHRDAECAMRHGVESERYRRRSLHVPANTMIGIVDEDPEAFGNEIELLIARTGFGTMDTDAVARQLGVRWEEKGHVVNQLMRYAAKYFPHGRGSDGRMSQEYIDFIEAEYRRFGARIFRYDPEGILVEKR